MEPRTMDLLFETNIYSISMEGLYGMPRLLKSDATDY